MRVYFTNLGCKLNQAENDSLARDFLAAGHQLAASLGEADLHVVNSCTVTAAAARSSRQAALAASRGASGRGPRTVLTGCYATASPAEAARLAGVDLVVPNADKGRLVERALQALGEASPAEPRGPSAAMAPAPEGIRSRARLPGGHTRALVKIEDGCDMRCAFCIIPATRGRQRSRPLEQVVDEVRGLALAGYREVVLTGVQISAYRAARGEPAPAAPHGEASAAPEDGCEPAGGRRGLAALVREVLAALPAARAGSPGNQPVVPPPALAPVPAARLRLTSIAPWELDDELLALWSDRRLCRHLHLSLQSGATATLRRMRRPYTAESFGRLIARVRAAVPGVAVTTDVIVGFPGESAEEHEESLSTVAALGFAKVHVFPFSPRPGTAAASLSGAVPAPELRQRMSRMLAAAERSELAFRTAHLGRREVVLWERPKDGTGRGLTDNYIRVFSPDGAALWNRLGEVELLALAPGGMLGRAL